ncbi:hypothetical protein BDV36DRAFT_245630 [Aspergillus pseudocaelatus]|uniref:Uncharacterized protein n=1 Tax=Aspergillus pseudocaelatus TaxID=1825620 RepID=A0ABQ6WZ95_9EURO|nr:hypothetical protein BDV36DRAFT_245630 [Aspergillus pseudocaelatus]
MLFGGCAFVDSSSESAARASGSSFISPFGYRVPTPSHPLSAIPFSAAQRFCRTYWSPSGCGGILLIIVCAFSRCLRDGARRLHYRPGTLPICVGLIKKTPCCPLPFTSFAGM